MRERQGRAPAREGWPADDARHGGAGTAREDAERILAPRLVPALTAAYESGKAVSFGRVQVSRAGIAASGWGSPGEGPPTTEISVSGLPNGVFLPRLLAFAATREGIMVTGYRKDGGGPAG